MLDEFSNINITKHQALSQRPEPTIVRDLHERNNTDEAANEFSKQLRDQMSALMGDLDESPEMKTEIEAMMQELGVATDPGTPPKSKDRVDRKSPSSNNEELFHETIRKTMERMQASGDEATAAAKNEDTDDMFAQILKEMQESGLEGAGDDEGFNKMLLGVMEHLTNKEILYEPMKELHDKFPRWMTENRSSTDPDDLQRYDKQQRLVGEIVERFEEKSYSDTHPSDREFVVERMQQVQDLANCIIASGANEGALDASSWESPSWSRRRYECCTKRFK